MPFIAMCANTRCPSRTTCYRYLAKPDKHGQTYDNFHFGSSEGKCESYWDSKEYVTNSLRSADEADYENTWGNEI